MIQKMCKVEVAGSKKRLPEVLEKIQTLGVLHVDEVPLLSPRPGKFELHRIPLTEKQEEEKNLLEKAADNFDEVSRMMVPMILEKAEMAFDRDIAKPSTSLSHEELVQKSKEILKNASDLQEKQSVLIDELRVLENYKQILNSLLPLIDKSPNIKSFRYIGITMAKEETQAMEVLEEELAKLTDKKAQLFKSSADKKNLVALVGFPPEYEKKVKDTIWDQGISEIKLPAGFQNQPLEESVKGLEKRLNELPAQLEKMKKKAEDYYALNGVEYVNLRRWTHSRLKRLKVIENCAQSHYMFVIVGWMPLKKLEWVQKKMAEAFGEDVVVNRLMPGRRDYRKVPVSLENSRFLRPFELLMKLFPPPTYGSIDVTALIGIVFPIFFGFILGDIFYGLCMAGACFLIKKKMGQKPIVAQALKIYYACTFWTIVFGALFGEFLGDVGHHYLGMKPFLYNREVDILFSMIVAIVIGMAHILLGLSLGIFLSFKIGDRHGFWAHLIYTLTIVDILVVIGAMMGVLPGEYMKPALWALAGFIPANIFLEGPMAPIELISTLGNMLSYARLMAIGLASVIMAVIANKFVTIFGSVVLGLMMAVLLHILNFALGVFAPTIQSLRLHYVEFFSKFYKPEGRAYEPFNMGETV